MSSTGGNTMRAGTPIAEDLRERYERCCHPDDEAYSAWECTLIERASASEERERVLNHRLNSMAHEPFNTPEELMQDLIRENSEFTKTIVRLRERERVLTKALDDAGRWLSVWEPSPQPAAHRARAVLDAALATPAPEQPAPLTVEVTEDGNVLVEDSARNLSVLALTEPLRITCPWDKQVWRFHTQEQADLFQKHLDWHAHSEQAEQPKGQQ